MRRHAPLLALLLVLFISPVVAAQSAIDRGKVTFTGSVVPSGQFTFEGPQLLTLTGGLRDGFTSPNCSPCIGGQEIRVLNLFSGDQSMRAGTLTTGSESRPVYFAGTLAFNSPPVTLPIRHSRVPFKIIVPIVLNGDLQIHSSNPFINGEGLLFVFPIHLQGTATLTFKTTVLHQDGRPFYKFMGATYEFPAPPPPEAK